MDYNNDTGGRIMSKCTPKSIDFIYAIQNAIEHSFYGVREVNVYYNAHPTHSKRDYVATITVSNDWNSEDTHYLKECMRNAGATNIIGGIKHAMVRDYLDLAFDIKKSKMKELGIDISKSI